MNINVVGLNCLVSSLLLPLSVQQLDPLIKQLSLGAQLLVRLLSVENDDVDEEETTDRDSSVEGEVDTEEGRATDPEEDPGQEVWQTAQHLHFTPDHLHTCPPAHLHRLPPVPPPERGLAVGPVREREVEAGGGEDEGGEGGGGADEWNGGGKIAISAAMPSHAQQEGGVQHAVQQQPQGEGELQTRLEPPSWNTHRRFRPSI